jgi:hypothetical protein
LQTNVEDYHLDFLSTFCAKYEYSYRKSGARHSKCQPAMNLTS